MNINSTELYVGSNRLMYVQHENKKYIRLDREYAKNRIAHLSKFVLQCKYWYYIQDAPIISDVIYDDLERELVAFEYFYPEFKVENSPTDMVGYPSGLGYPGRMPADAPSGLKKLLFRKRRTVRRAGCKR